MRRWLVLLTIMIVLASGVSIASADNQQTAKITANLEQTYIDITVTGNITNWILMPQTSNENKTAIHLGVDSNSPAWYVAIDDYDFSVLNKIVSGSAGYMTPFSDLGGGVGDYYGTHLVEPIRFKAANDTWEGPAWVWADPLVWNPILETEVGNSPGTYDIWVQQNTTASDQALAVNYYKFVVLFMSGTGNI